MTHSLTPSARRPSPDGYGKRAKLIASLEKTAARLQKHQCMIDAARATIDAKRNAMRPKFDKMDPVILVAVAAKVVGSRAAFGAVGEAAEFQPHQFAQFLEKVAPPDKHALAAEARETETFAAQSILIAAEGLSHDARMKLHTDLLEQASAHLKGGGD